MDRAGQKLATAGIRQHETVRLQRYRLLQYYWYYLLRNFTRGWSTHPVSQMYLVKGREWVSRLVS